MADQPRSPGADGGGGLGSDRKPKTGTPRWVKVFAIVAVVAVLLFVVSQFVGGGGHGPGRHAGEAGDHVSLARRS